ncbi:MAG: hypothetical protein KDC95_14080 [Planctomycetes bacterium]|nr:hypothetical protein [Planctomycetota bacterium]
MSSRTFARSAWSSLSLVLAFASFVSCGQNGSKTASIGDITLPAVPSGEVSIAFQLTDPIGGSTDVAFEVSLDGGTTWQPGTLVGKDTLKGLRGAALGRLYEFVWDSLEDVGFRTKGEILLSLRTSGSGSRRIRSLGSLENLGFAADRVESYLVHFGPWDASTIAFAQQHDLVILSATEATTTREIVATIQRGVDANDPRDDVIVLGYVNVGEDARTIGIHDDALLLDRRFVGDASGPRVDPRGPGPDGRPLDGIDPLGSPAASGGYASFYLDDNSIEALGKSDGKPDRNRVTGACYVNAGSPAWFDTLRAMTRDSIDGIAGLSEIMTLDVGAGLGCDGVFLDNVDTCAPNSFTSPKDDDHATFEWTAPGMSAFFARLRKEFRRQVVAQNRGLFFMNPEHHHYSYSTRPSIDFLLLESYRLDLDTSHAFDPYFFADNKYVLAPKLQAEAYRSDGFQVLSLGYAAGPGIDAATLIGASTAGEATLLEDIVEAQELAGFRHFLTDVTGTLVNDFVRKHASYEDERAPRWTSTFNANIPPYPALPLAATPRVGIRQAVGGSRELTVRWDVALDLHPVRYVLYLDQDPLRFQKDGKVIGVKPIRLQPSVGAGYANGTSPTVYPYEATIHDLDENKTYYACIRAIDSKRNEDTNQVVLAARTTR